MKYDENKILEYIEFLGLPEKFDLNILKKVYKINVLKFHPDRTSDNNEKIKLENRMKKINEFYEILKQYLQDNGGEYCSPNYKNAKNETKAENKATKHTNTQKKENKQKEKSAIDKEYEEFYNKFFDEDFDEYFEHLNNDNEEEFEKYLRNLYKNFKDPNTRETLIKSELKYRTEEKLDNKLGCSGCFLYLAFLIFVGLFFIFKNDIFISACLICLGLWVLNGFIFMFVKLFRKF